MSDTNVKINILFNGSEVNTSIQEITANFSSFNSVLNDIKIIKLQSLVNVFKDVKAGLSELTESGASFEYSMAELSAMTGVVGDGLADIGKLARENAKIFGGDASKSVETYKLLLGQLTPELAKTPQALSSMGRHVSILSKQMGNDAVAATEVLTTAMNQYQISLDDPILASQEMADMMNIMTAAALEGSAELPQIKAALEQVGMVAKTASVTFAETNAAIQVLDKAGKKGSEGGVALRNIIGDLEKGRFLPKIVKDEFKAVGVDVDVLGDRTLSLTDRLRALQPIIHDSALLSKLFGEANYASGVALLSNIDEIDRLNTAIKETNAAEEYAGMVMETYNERLSRIRAGFEDFKISIFSVTGSFMPFVEIIGSGAVEIARLYPLGQMLSTLFKKSLYVEIGKSSKAIFSWTKSIIWNKVIMSSWLSIQAVYITVTNLLTGSINMATAATRIFNAVFLKSPLGWIALGVGAIAGAFALLKNNAQDAAEETGKTLKNLKETAALKIQEETGNKKAATVGSLSLMKAELDGTVNDDEISAIAQKYETETGVPFDIKNYKKDKESYWSQYSNAVTKSATITGANSGIQAGIEEYVKALDSENRKIAEDEWWNENMAGKLATEGYWTAGNTEGSMATYIKPSYYSGRNIDYSKRDGYEKEIKRLQEELSNNIAENNENLEAFKTVIIPTNLSKNDKDTSTIKGGEGIKNINITINDGLVNDVKNYFQGGEYNFDDFMNRLKLALMLVLNDANTI
jgi:TP901 family phage tail tape measure protein